MELEVDKEVAVKNLTIEAQDKLKDMLTRIKIKY